MLLHLIPPWRGSKAMIELDFSKRDGLLPAIAQDYTSGKISMLAYINKDSWEKSLETGEVHYWSRSRQEIWHKGGTSGHVQKIKEIYMDCDQDTVVFKVEQAKVIFIEQVYMNYILKSMF